MNITWIFIFLRQWYRSQLQRNNRNVGMRRENEEKGENKQRDEQLSDLLGSSTASNYKFHTVSNSRFQLSYTRPFRLNSISMGTVSPWHSGTTAGSQQGPFSTIKHCSNCALTACSGSVSYHNFFRQRWLCNTRWYYRVFSLGSAGFWIQAVWLRK